MAARKGDSRPDGIRAASDDHGGGGTSAFSLDADTRTATDEQVKARWERRIADARAAGATPEQLDTLYVASSYVRAKDREVVRLRRVLTRSADVDPEQIDEFRRLAREGGS